VVPNQATQPDLREKAVRIGDDERGSLGNRPEGDCARTDAHADQIAQPLDAREALAIELGTIVRECVSEYHEGYLKCERAIGALPLSLFKDDDPPEEFFNATAGISRYHDAPPQRGLRRNVALWHLPRF